MRILCSVALAIIALCNTVHAGPRFAACFGDHVVLQRGESTQVWGFDATPGSSLAVRLGTSEIKASVQADGQWGVILPLLETSTREQKLELLEYGQVVATIHGVLVGEVWLAAGQSNMQMLVRSMVKDDRQVRVGSVIENFSPTVNWLQSASLSTVRFRRVNDPVLPDRNAEASDLATSEPWVKMSPATVGNFSATAAVFAREIAEKLDCPVGIIDVSWGGKPIEPFIPRESFDTPLLSQIKALADAEKLNELGKLRGGVIIRNPEGSPGSIFNARMAPLARFGLAGFLWYQAESNAGRDEDPREYRHKMAALASGWRERWGDDSLPLNFVQLPSFPDATGWIRVREEQRRSLQIPNSAMTVTIDIRGEGIHPPDKLEVGRRLAKSALKNTYEMENIVATGPQYRSHTVSGNEVTIQFLEIHGGLAAGNRPLFSAVEFNSNGKLNWFEVAGADGAWHAASAVIKGDTVVVSSADEPKPVAVRYACHTNPQGGNLYNRAGMPASPFCSNLEMLGWEDQGQKEKPIVMKSTYSINAPPEKCLRAWLEPGQLNRWLSTSAELKDNYLSLTSRLPNVSGRHQLIEQSNERLVFDWYIDGYRTKLELNFEAEDEGTLLSLTHRTPAPIPEGLIFPPGKHYGDQVWNFAISNLRYFLETGKRAMEMPWPHNPHQIDLEIVIDAKPERVWAFLTTVENLKAASLVEDAAKIEPRIGGRYSFGWTEIEGDEADGPGFISDWVEQKKLSVGWYGGRDSIVSWQLSGKGKDATRIKFSHTGLIFSPANTLSYQFGWSEFLLEMKLFLEEEGSAKK